MTSVAETPRQPGTAQLTGMLPAFRYIPTIARFTLTFSVSGDSVTSTYSLGMSIARAFGHT